MESIVRIHSVISGFAMICGIFYIIADWRADGKRERFYLSFHIFGESVKCPRMSDLVCHERIFLTHISFCTMLYI